MHWVYILRCSRARNRLDRIHDRIYVGETTRLFRRLKEHCEEQGAYTTIEFPPERLIGLYKVENDAFLIHECDWTTDDTFWALSLENDITEMYMQAMGRKWENVNGGKYCRHSPDINPSINKTFYRPYCDCRIPADIKEYKGKKYWRCSKKNIWDDLTEYITDILGMGMQDIVEPCKFYKEYKKNEKFTCTNLIYACPINNIKLTGKCLILDDSDEE